MEFNDERDDLTDRASSTPDRLPASHPFLLALSIDPADWFDFERLDADNPATRIVARDAPQNGKMVIHIACASRETRQRLEAGWG